MGLSAGRCTPVWSHCSGCVAGKVACDYHLFQWACSLGTSQSAWMEVQMDDSLWKLTVRYAALAVQLYCWCILPSSFFCARNARPLESKPSATAKRKRYVSFHRVHWEILEYLQLRWTFNWSLQFTTTGLAICENGFLIFCVTFFIISRISLWRLLWSVWPDSSPLFNTH